MDAVEATSLAECLEFELGALAQDARVECFAVPRTRASTRRSTGWLFLVVTSLPENVVRQALSMPVEVVERRGSRRCLVAWPPGR